MKNQNGNLWMKYGKNNNRLSLPIPHPLAEEMAMGEFTSNEMQILIYISKLTFGFNREVTYHLDLGDFSRDLKLHPSTASRVIKRLLERSVILRHSEQRRAHRYSINLLRYGMEMKHYIICEIYNQTGNGELKIRKEDYQIYKLDETKDYVIYYTPDPFVIRAADYKYNDKYINNNKDSIDTHTPDALGASVSNGNGLSKDEIKILQDFDNEFKTNKSVMVYMQHLEELNQLNPKDGFGILSRHFQTKYIEPYGIETNTAKERDENYRYWDNALTINSCSEYNNCPDKKKFHGDDLLWEIGRLK